MLENCEHWIIQIAEDIKPIHLKKTQKLVYHYAISEELSINLKDGSQLCNSSKPFEKYAN